MAQTARQHSGKVSRPSMRRQLLPQSSVRTRLLLASSLLFKARDLTDLWSLISDRPLIYSAIPSNSRYPLSNSSGKVFPPRVSSTPHPFHSLPEPPALSRFH